MVQIGDKVKKRLNIFSDKDYCTDSRVDTFYGTVIWIHPKMRFYVVEFTTRSGGKFRSCFDWRA